MWLLAAPAHLFAALPSASDTPISGLGGNEVGDIVYDGRTIWVAVGPKLSKLVGSGERSADWKTYTYGASFPEEDISALWVHGDTIWVASWYPTTYLEQSIRAGNGLHRSTDGGLTWRHFETEDLFLDRREFRFPDNSTVAYDLAMDRGTFWASYTAGFAVRTTDGGTTWEQVLPDSGGFVFKNPGHHGQCLIAYSDTIWVGTFGGIHRSVDGGTTWTNYGVETPGISGSFVPALARQVISGRSLIWAGTKPFNAGEAEGISVTENGGETWRHINVRARTTDFAFEDTVGLSAWNFSFADTSYEEWNIGETTLWAATDEGLFRTDDLGETWAFVEIRDPATGEPLPDPMVIDVEMRDGVLWASASEVGLAKSGDGGRTWRILRSPVKTVSLDAGRPVDENAEHENIRTYAYPSPFSPDRDRMVRIQYSLSAGARITIKVYDFANRLVKVLLRDEFRTGPSDHGLDWNGRNDAGDGVANGVYFYRIETDGGHRAFGKIVVLN